MALNQRVETIENSQDDIRQAMVEVQDTIKNQEVVMNSLLDRLDDYENRNWRQNICIRRPPETIETSDLLQSAQSLFRQILGDLVLEKIKIDRVHHTLMSSPLNTERPRDIICKLHKYAMKEAIMKAARSKSKIDFEGGQISLFMDLSRRTLMQRRAVRPLLNVNYRWGFPFCIMAW